MRRIRGQRNCTIRMHIYEHFTEGCSQFLAHSPLLIQRSPAVPIQLLHRRLPRHVPVTPVIHYRLSVQLPTSPSFDFSVGGRRVALKSVFFDAATDDGVIVVPRLNGELLAVALHSHSTVTRLLLSMGTHPIAPRSQRASRY
jgi:hypothetical protein